MKFKIFIFALFISFSSFGEKTDISSSTFNNYILPSLKKLMEDYHTLLINLDPLNKEVLSLREEASNLEKKWNSFTRICFESLDKCKQDFISIKNEFIQENQKILNIEKDFKLSSKHSKTISNARVLMSNTVNALSDYSHKITVSLDLFKFKRKDFFEITDHLKNLKLNLNILTTGFLDNEYQDNFYFIYSNFFKMLENDIIERANLELFKRELENLNISWNTFNMKVPKWKASLSSETLGLIESMHKRWNSILKLIWGN
jgi:hypothetical protein